MKNKLLALMLCATLFLGLSGCNNSPKEQTPSGGSTADTPKNTPDTPQEEPISIRVAGLKGPTAMGMVKLMEDAQQGKTNGDYQFTLAGAPDELTGKIIQGEFDVAAVPTNLAAVLYNKTGGKVQLAALNTLGVLYIVENGNSIQTMEDLRGKTIVATGKGSTPEFALNYLLAQNNMVVGKDVQVEYKTEHSELAALLAAGQADVALLPQPFVTGVLTQNQNARVALDLTAEWEKVAGSDSALTMGCLLVQKDFAQKNPQALAAFLKEYKASVEYVTNEANLADAAALIEKFDIAKAAVAQKALPQCNIVFIDGKPMQAAASGFYQVLFDADPISVGGALPQDDFYYLGQ